MSSYAHGYDHFNHVTPVDPSEDKWRGIFQESDPLLRNVLHAGISAVKFAVEQSESPEAAAILEENDLLQDSRVTDGLRAKISAELSRSPGKTEHPDIVNLGSAGFSILAIALSASRFFHAYPDKQAEPKPHTLNAKRTIEDKDEQAYLGQVIRTPSIKELQAKLFDGSNTHLNLTAVFDRPGQSVSANLEVSMYPEARITNTRVTSGSRWDERTLPTFTTSFSVLDKYVAAIDSLE